MDPELIELIALWLGDEDPGEPRREALLARLRADADFRRAFLEEVRTLGMLRAVQSAEPRWLRLEDAIGWSAQDRRDDGDALAERVVRIGAARMRVRRWARAALALAAGVLLFVGLFALLRGDRQSADGAKTSSAVELATAVQLDGARFDGTPLVEGGVVAAGRIRLTAGRMTLTFFSGVSLTLEGPAELELLDRDRVFCRSGKLRVRVPPGAEGFTVGAPGYEVVDLGTEFGLNLEPGGKSRLMVFEGEAAVSVLGADGRSVQSALVEGPKSVEVEPGAARIQEIPAQPDAFVVSSELTLPALELGTAYRDAVLRSVPWGYWRFEALDGNRLHNEIEGRPALKAFGGLSLERADGGNRCVRFRPRDSGQALVMDGEWAPTRPGGYAMEMWLQSEGVGQSALASLIAQRDPPHERHVALLELTARSRHSPHEPFAVRFLDRWPPGTRGGVDVFSRRTVAPARWHHVVGQKNGEVVELYIDGELVGSSPAKLNAADAEAATTACWLLVGRLKQWANPHKAGEVRPFEGRLDELALYDRSLSADEIRRHFASRNGDPPAAP